MGGGTPSLFSPEAIADLLNFIHAHIPLEKNAEITLEANPGTVDEARFTGFHQAGVNRLSLGVQSFQNKHLKKLGRIHDTDAAQRAIHALKSAGFKRWNIDLMHGLPEQTFEEAMQDLETALRFEPSHLSWYQLTIEPNTVFYKHPPTLPADDLLASIQDEGEKILEAAGLKHYEISAFAKPDEESRHNKNYWLFGDYLGIGAGAHSKISSYQEDRLIIERMARARQPKDYMNTEKNNIAERKTIEHDQLAFEFMMNAMRLNQPITRQLFEERTGLKWQSISEIFEKAQSKKLLIADKILLMLTPLGRRFLNDVLALFL